MRFNRSAGVIRLRGLKTSSLVVFLLAGISLCAGVEGEISESELKGGPFAPSNARTEHGGLIKVEEFFSASRCSKCHSDTHRSWSESLHRNAAREPFYRESVDILLRTRGIEPTRHCESCHTPIALFSGALVKGAARSEAPFTDLDDEGVTCSVCHSITGATLDGTGSFTIRRPALLAREDGTPVYGDVTDQQVLSDVAAHKRAVMRPLMKQPEFCATCHKVAAPRELNNYKHIKGFSVFDEWQQSGASHESLTPFYTRERRADCRACHMPKVESTNDRAAKNGMISSHRWLGANTAAPLFYDDLEQVRQTEKFLKAELVSVDIFALRRNSVGELIAPLAQAASQLPVDRINAGRNDNRAAAAPARGVNGEGQAVSLMVEPGEEFTAEVVISNRNVAHSFPAEIRDLYEAWVEFEVLNSSGKTIYHSGFIKPGGLLDESAHVYKSLLLDEAGRTITRHQIWLTNIKGYDNAIQAGRSDVARFEFRLPDEECGPVTLRARVNYRRFNQEYTDYVLNRRGKSFSLPLIEMARAEVMIVPDGANASKSDRAESAADSRRWNDYGIGLLDQSQYGQAAYAFRRAAQLNPADPNLLVNAAIAEMRTERFGPEREQLRKARVLIDQALALNRAHARARFYNALLLRAEGQARTAARELAGLAHKFPRDRELQRQLGQTLYAIGEIDGARKAFEAVAAIDPQDSGAYQFLGPIYLGLNLQHDAARVRELYLQWRDDPLADTVAARFYAAHPEWADERIGVHRHGHGSADRKILKGLSAAPDR